ncbi:F-actin-capping protein subunit beta [Phytophthora cinnamomi]|uniref:F-actin-capping protein subunit beta n=1 Tax=Phytophthora cinnamomi TaxID=4785 RepID=UPI0035596DBA|nr:F-actin-capping protein subunit beta [Phytophthora cinnamomi]
MPHLEEFFTHGGGAAFCAGSHAPEAAQPSAREGEELRDGGLLFLHGPQDAGQTSLLLQFGFSQVQAGRSVVLVMCGSAGASQQPAASQIVPLTPCARCRLPVQTGEDNGVWGRIHIKYLRSNAELQHFLCSLHVVGKKTSVLLVESFERFFADQSHMGSVYQTLAFLLEAQEYMKKATGSGVVVVTGNTDAFLLRDRPLLRRWCRFLEIVPDVEEPDVYTLREEVEDTADVGDDVARVQVRYEFSLPSSQDDIGTFQLQHVQRHSGFLR